MEQNEDTILKGEEPAVQDQMISDSDSVRFDDERLMLVEVQNEPWYVRFKTYFKLSGPGWLQSALTLGGGSLTSSLYLGVLAGFTMLWLQPVAMVLGIIMLSALGYATLATDQRPFHAVNEHINPVLGWGWAIGSILASLVWVMPQYALANGVIQQNLFPTLLGAGSALGSFGSTLLVSLTILAVALTIAWNYGGDSKSVNIFEWILKGLVALIVLAFVGVVLRIAMTPGSINWGEVLAGFIPNPALALRPAAGFEPLLAQLSASSAEYWSNLIVTRQQEVMAAALSSAVGINATFLFAYSMLRRKWGTEYTGLMRFDLWTGMLIPFMLVTSFIIIAAGNQFHTVPHPGFLEDSAAGIQTSEQMTSEYQSLLEGRIIHEFGLENNLTEAQVASYVSELGQEDHLMAATLVTRDAFDLASSLEPLLGGTFSHIIFGIGVVGMAISSVILHMVICGFVICEILKVPYNSWYFRAGIMIPVVGVLGPFFWDQAAFWLAIPTSVITLMLLPIAYVVFFLMLNNKAIMGKNMPTGRKRIAWNSVMIPVIIIVSLASFYMLWQYAGVFGLGILVAFVLAALGFEWRKRTQKATA